MLFALAMGACATAGTAPDRNIQPSDAHAPATPRILYSARCKLPGNVQACTQLASDQSATIQILADWEHTSDVSMDVLARRPVYSATLAMQGPERTAASLFQDLLLNNGWRLVSRAAQVDRYVGVAGGPHADQAVTFHYLGPSGGFFLVRATATGNVIP